MLQLHRRSRGRGQAETGVYCQQALYETRRLVYLGSKFTIVNMKVCTTDSGGLYFDLSSC